MQPDPRTNQNERSMNPPAPDSYVPHGVDVLRTYGEGFAGREAELAALDRSWNERAVRVFVLHAEGGAGKTRVVAKWLMQMRDDGWRGAGRVFVHSFYSQGSDERRNASSELFFEQALEHFGYTGLRLTDPTEQGRTLSRLLIEQHGLLVLDGIEPLQHPPSFDQGRLKDPAIRSLLRSLAAGRLGDSSSTGLCVVTSRQLVVELQDKLGRAAVQKPLDRLDATAGVELLWQLEVRGPERELREAVEDAHGHAYSLMLLGSYLRDATDDHEIRRRREIPLLEEDKEHRYHARHLFGAYVRHLGETSPEVAVLHLLGFFDRPAEEKLLAVLSKAQEPELDTVTSSLQNLSETDWRRVLRRLTDLRLIDVPVSPSPPVDSHPLLREYFADQLRMRFPEVWQAGHRRLFEYLCKATEYRPSTLPGLQPLYHAVAHGCLAGLHEKARKDVYCERILQGTKPDEFYSTKRLGAVGSNLGALAYFFAIPWTTLMPILAPVTHGWLLHEAAFNLRALGRLNEAIEPLRAGLAEAIKKEEWAIAAVRASNLSELELSRGEIADASNAGEHSVFYAVRAKEGRAYIMGRVGLAYALLHAGHCARSAHIFSEVEMQFSRIWPQLKELPGNWGFKQGEVQLTSAERWAWRVMLEDDPRGAWEFEPRASAIFERATRRLNSDHKNGQPLLQLSLDHLALARSALYKSLLAAYAARQEPSNQSLHITAAVDGLRKASDMIYLPHGLLTRAWIRCISDDKPGSREDLDEAWEIAERGPMPLFQADIQLTRARLFRDRDALAEARRLIEKHEYHRRDGELADAEAAAAQWGLTYRSPFPSHTHPPREGETILKATNKDSMRDQVFISYSHRDKKLTDELLIHLKPLQRSRPITTWSDQQIASGSQWFSEIQAALGKTSVAVLLVSPDFLASDFIHEHELGPLLKEAKAGGVRILWIPLRASAYEETPLKDYQAVSPPDKPLAQMSKAGRDETWVRVCKEIANAVNP
jgi:TIR domain